MYTIQQVWRRVVNRLFRHTVLAAHNPTTGHFDAVRLAKTFNCTTKEIAGIPHRTLHDYVGRSVA